MKNKKLLVAFLLYLLIVPFSFAQNTNDEKEFIKQNKEMKKQEAELKRQALAMKEVHEALAEQAVDMRMMPGRPPMPAPPDPNVYKNLTLQKMFRNESLVKEVTFDVNNDFSEYRDTNPNDRFILNLKGSCSSGAIKITIYGPSGKVFKELTIDPSANVSWSQYVMFTVEKKYQGTWKTKIEAENARGFYDLSFSIVYAPF